MGGKRQPSRPGDRKVLFCTGARLGAVWTDTPFVLASTRRISDFIAAEHVVAAVTIHGYIGTFTYPWGIFTNDSHTPDHDAFRSMALQTVAVNGYGTDTHKDAIDPTAGAFEDWAYHEHGVWVMLLEIARRPDVERDARALLQYFAVAPSPGRLHQRTAFDPRPSLTFAPCRCWIAGSQRRRMRCR